MTITEAFNLALSHQQAGRLAQAEPIYRQIIKQVPNHAEAWHLLGVLRHQAGNTAEGIQLVEHALAMRRDPEFLANFAELLRESGQLERGIACCQEAIQRAPTLVAAHQNLSALFKASRPA